jgi:predicted GTPase
MATNLFEEVQHRKQQMKQFADAALEKAWIDKSTYDGIVEKINNDTLTIGVIGQMKCGKSTFLNAFLFEDDVLPAATTPMTAALSVITYGETKRIEAEFYSKTEWDEMQMKASRDLNEAKGDKAKESEIKAARELVEKASCLGSSLQALLGTKKTDNFENLIEYVGADGHYVAITKSVTIYYPKEWLKGVEIVDTPGFNDPVVSREERTQEFLKRADVVLMLLYAGRAFDATDRDIVFEKVRNVGVGKVLIGINKYDLCYSEGETIEEIIINVENEIRKACREHRDSYIRELLENLKPIPFSANMALMAKMPSEKIKSDSDLRFHWNESCDTFEISTQKEMLKKSLIGDLESAIQEVLEKSKAEILFKKPTNMILQAGLNIKAKSEKDFNDKKILFESLSMPDDELHERIEGLSKAQKRIEKKIGRTIDDLEESYDEEVSKIIHSLEDIVDNARNEINHIIDTEKISKIDNKVKYRLEKLVDREVPHAIEKAEKNLHNLLKEKAEDFNSTIEEIIRKYVPNPDDLLDNFKNAIRKGITLLMNEQEGEESIEENSAQEDDFSIGDFLSDFFKGFFIIPVIYEYLSYRDDCHTKANAIFSQINFNEVRKALMDKKPEYINLLHTTAVNEILESLISQLNKVLNDKSNREEKLGKAEEEMNILSKEKERVANEIAEMQRMKMAIM